MVRKETIRCDNCNKLVKDLWEMTITRSDWQLWTMQFCSKKCLETHNFDLEEDSY